MRYWSSLPLPAGVPGSGLLMFFRDARRFFPVEVIDLLLWNVQSNASN